MRLTRTGKNGILSTVRAIRIMVFTLSKKEVGGEKLKNKV